MRFASMNAIVSCCSMSVMSRNRSPSQAGGIQRRTASVTTSEYLDMMLLTRRGKGAEGAQQEGGTAALTSAFDRTKGACSRWEFDAPGTPGMERI